MGLPSTYDEFQDRENSSKVTLVIMEASQRLLGWEVFSGVIYRLTNFDVAIIKAIEDSGTAYSAGSSSTTLASSEYFHDNANDVLYIRTSDDSDPNTRFLVLTRKLFFSTHPAKLSFDLASGQAVFWEPLVQSTSNFGVELDNRNQFGNAIEGNGTITFLNDADSSDTNSFWRRNYMALFFENHLVEVYSWSLGLPATEAKLLFKGRTKSKAYSRQRIRFRVQDLLSELRGEIQLDNISTISDVKVTDDLLTAKKRRIYGRVFGHRPTNIDQVVDGYPVTGTVAVTGGATTITGTGTLFLKEVSPDDKLIIDEVELTVASVTDDLNITLTEAYVGGTQTAATVKIVPEISKPYINRIWNVAGHAIRQPETTVTNASSLNFIEVADATDIIAGDKVFVGAAGTGELVTVQRVSSNFLKFEENLLLAPTVGTSVIRPGVQNVRINNTELRFDRDFTFDATTATITLDEQAEFNVAPIRDVIGTVTFNGTRTVTGSGTVFDSQLQPGEWIRSVGEADFFEILSIESPTSLTLRTVATYSATAGANYKPVKNFVQGEDVLSCDSLGITLSGAKDGTLIQKGAQIVKHLIQDAGVTDIDAASFTTSEDLAASPLGVVVPKNFSDQKTPTFRTVINKVNISIFGSLIQNNDFQLQYNILSPKRQVSINVLREVDILKFTADTTNEFMVKDVFIDHKHKEYNPATATETFDQQTDASLIAEFILRTTRVKRVETLLSFASDALIFARRWRHILEIGHTVLKLQTKMDTADLQVNDRIEVIHRKLFERVGGGSRKISAVQSIRKSAGLVDIELEDLADAFNKSATITENTAVAFDDSSQDEKVGQGYITDNNGMISNRGPFNIKEDTSRLNRIW